MKNKKIRVSIVIPVYNAESTIELTLQSLFPQKEYFSEIILIDDGSKDNSIVKAKKILAKTSIKYFIIRFPAMVGLAYAYNQGIKKAIGELVITLHSDVILTKGALKALIEPFLQDRARKTVVAAISTVIYPEKIWKTYNFWQKCLFDRFLEMQMMSLDGKFTCFRKKTLVQIGYFHDLLYTNAGEDSDIRYRLLKIGNIIQTKAKAIHLHVGNNSFSWKNLIYKHAQLAQAQGVLFRNNGLDYFTFYTFVVTFFRELLLIGLFIPYIQYFSFVLIILYAYLYTRHIYIAEFPDKRLIILPFFNILLLFVSLVYSIEGYINKKQTI